MDIFFLRSVIVPGGAGFVTGYDIMVYRSITDLNANQWNNLVSHSELGSVFHRYEWLASIEAGMDSSPMHVVMEKNGNPVGIWPNFVSDLDIPDVVGTRALREYLEVLVSVKPGFGGFVLSSDDSDVLQSFVARISAECENSIVSHRIVSSTLGQLRYSRQLRKNGYLPARTTCRFVLDLDRPWDDIRDAMHSGRRKEVRRIEDSELEATEKPLSGDTVDSFYDNYRRVIDRVGGTPYPKPFFHELANRMNDALKLVVATHDGREVGTLLFVVDEHQSVVYSMFPGVPERDFRPSPLVVIYAHTIKWGMDNDIAVLDFGDTSCDFQDGIFRFKEKFGGRVVPTIIWEKGVSPVRWNCYRLGRAAYYRYGDILARTLQQLPTVAECL